MKRRMRQYQQLILEVTGITDKSVHIWIDIRISNGLHLSQKNLSYLNLVRIVEKLEDLC